MISLTSCNTKYIIVKENFKMADVVIECKDCGKKFTVSEQEQKWYEDRKFDLPKRCPDCRKAKRSNRKK